MHIVNKKGDIIKLSPKINYKSLKHWYHIRCFEYKGDIKAINKYMAMVKFVLRHPLVIFKLDI